MIKKFTMIKRKDINISWGINKKSEKLNGQFAMFGFLSILVIEFINKKNIIDYLKF